MKKRIACVLFIICIMGMFGCSRQPVEETEEEIKIESDADYFVAAHVTNGTSFCEIQKREYDGKRPIVFFNHGLGGNKEQVISYAKKIADAGYVAVIQDCAGHGETVSDETLDFFDMIQSTALGCMDILRFYDGSGQVDSSRYAVCGISMGGMVALYLGAYSENRPQAVATICSTPDFASLLGSKEIYVQSTEGALSSIDDEEQRKELIMAMAINSPDQNMEQLLQIPILLINGTADEIVPVAGIRSFEAKSSLYENFLQCDYIEGRGHDISEGDLEKILEFIQEYMPVEQ